MKGEVYGKRDLSNVLGQTKRVGAGAGTGAPAGGGNDRGGRRERRRPNNNNRKAE
jgi:small subunit ribosomal protein S3